MCGDETERVDRDYVMRIIVISLYCLTLIVMCCITAITHCVCAGCFRDLYPFICFN